MDFLRVKMFRKSNKPKLPDESNSDSPQDPPPPAAVTMEGEEILDEDEDDDFIANEVKRIKELRKNSFMGLIPEESSCAEEEADDDDETSSSEWRESDDAAGDVFAWCGFDAFYGKYCERMLFFDKMRIQQLKDAESADVPHHSPKTAPRKLASALRSFSFKKRDEFEEDYERLQQSSDNNNPYQNLETAYVAQVCLSWEILHCQYMQLSQFISSQLANPTSYSYAAQAFQQFHVLLQRFIENEPFEQGSRVEIFAHSRSSLPKLLQVPNYQGYDEKQYEADDMSKPIHAADLRKIVEEAILTFRLFLKADKKKPTGSLHLFKGHGPGGRSIQQIQASLDKEEAKLKELSKKKGWKKKTWPSTVEEVELLLGLIDVKVVARVLRMQKISKEQLLWCEEKMSKLDMSGKKLTRDGSPLLFPC